MKAHALNLLIVDSNKLAIDKLSKYLEKKFGIRVNISPFFDVESCVVNIDERSHVIVLDYFLKDGEKENRKGIEIFNSIKNKNPNTKVAMITSDKDFSEAIDEIQNKTSSYVIKQQGYLQKIFPILNRIILSPAYTMIVSPVKVRIILPIKNIISEYTLQDYLVMFIVAFISVGSLVVIGLKLFR